MQLAYFDTFSICSQVFSDAQRSHELIIYRTGINLAPFSSFFLPIFRMKNVGQFLLRYSMLFFQYTFDLKFNIENLDFYVRGIFHVINSVI